MAWTALSARRSRSAGSSRSVHRRTVPMAIVAVCSWLVMSWPAVVRTSEAKRSASMVWCRSWSRARWGPATASTASSRSWSRVVQRAPTAGSSTTTHVESVRRLQSRLESTVGAVPRHVDPDAAGAQDPPEGRRELGVELLDRGGSGEPRRRLGHGVEPVRGAVPVHASPGDRGERHRQGEQDRPVRVVGAHHQPDGQRDRGQDQCQWDRGPEHVLHVRRFIRWRGESDGRRHGSVRQHAMGDQSDHHRDRQAGKAQWLCQGREADHGQQAERVRHEVEQVPRCRRPSHAFRWRDQWHGHRGHRRPDDHQPEGLFGRQGARPRLPPPSRS